VLIMARIPSANSIIVLTAPKLNCWLSRLHFYTIAGNFKYYSPHRLMSPHLVVHEDGARLDLSDERCSNAAQVKP